MRAALELERIVTLLKSFGVDKSILNALMALYKDSYREGYEDGKCDCEELQSEKEEMQTW